ncbi:hypothetical protein ACCT20_30070 [Rhizobium ruizarguesonis]
MADDPKTERPLANPGPAASDIPETQAKRDVIAIRDDVETEREIEAFLAWHDENVRAAICTLLNDIRHLRHQA